MKTFLFFVAYAYYGKYVFSINDSLANTSISASKQGLINGMRTTALSITNHVLFTANIPAEQPLGVASIGVVFRLRLSAKVL